MPDTPPTRQILTRLEDAGFYHKEIASLLDVDRSLVTHWANGTRTMPLDSLGRLGRETARRWPERRHYWAELLLGDLARLLGCRLVPTEPTPGRVLYLSPEQLQQLQNTQTLLTHLLKNTPCTNP